MAWFTNFFKNLGSWKAGSELYREGKEQIDYGRGISEEGLAGLRDLFSRFDNQIAEGGLSPDLRRQFEVATGRLNDQYVRSGRSLKSALENRRMQSGGALSAGAIAELEKEGEVAAGEQFFDASNNLAGEKAMLSYQATQELFDRMLNIQDTIRTHGLTQEQQGLMARLQAAAMQLQRRQAIAATAASVTGAAISRPSTGSAAPIGGGG